MITEQQSLEFWYWCSTAFQQVHFLSLSHMYLLLLTVLQDPTLAAHQTGYTESCAGH